MAKSLRLLHQASIALVPFQPSKSMENFLEESAKAEKNRSKKAQQDLTCVRKIEQLHNYSCHSPCHLNLCQEMLFETPPSSLNNALHPDATHRDAVKLSIIDWGFASMGNPAYELANLCALE